MGKLSNILLKSLLFGAAKAQNDTFAVTGCNAADNSPALTFRISQAYFENNLSGQTNDFEFSDGFYSRTIPQNELELGFDNDTDDIVLSYTILTESPTFQSNANNGISFADESVQFQCRYPRTVNSGSQMTLAPPPPQPVFGVGEFIYSMDIQVGPHGGETIVNINANHNIEGIVPRITKCRIHMDEQEIYAAHSFSGDVCFDNSILNMVQTSFGKDIGFSFRTFRFTGADQASGDQEQTVSCELHLEPAADIPHKQASGCTCHDVEDCAGPFEWVEDPQSVCWGMCNEQGGQCSGCMNGDPDATAGYCCSGVNHHGGGGPAANGDCPADAIAAVTTTVHSCVVKKKVTLPTVENWELVDGWFADYPPSIGQNRYNSKQQAFDECVKYDDCGGISQNNDGTWECRTWQFVQEYGAVSYAKPEDFHSR